MTARGELCSMATANHAWSAVEANAALDRYRAALADEFAAALLAVDPVEWALAGQHAGADAAKLIRRLACASTPDTPCHVCTHPRADHGDGQLDAMCQAEQCFCRTWHKDAESVARLLNAKEAK